MSARRAGLGLLAAASQGLSAMSAAADDPVRLYAAGSLRAAMTEIATAFEKAEGIAVAGTFGPSGLLRNRIVAGEAAEVFASANTEHPQSLAAAGRAAPVRIFAFNRLCALANPKVTMTSDTLLARMLDPTIKLGTSTPKADPSGDYAWMLFTKAEHQVKGAEAKLKAKALTLTGGPNSPPPPKGRSVYGKLVEDGAADIFLTYCTNAVAAQREVPALQVIAVPEALAVGAEYGMTVIRGARPAAQRFADFVLSPASLSILERHGFRVPPPR